MIFSLIAGFILGVAALFFALQNTQVVALMFLSWHFESSLALLVIVSVGFGILLSILVSIPSTISSTLKIMGLKKENKNLVQEVETHKQALESATASNQAQETIDLRKD